MTLPRIVISTGEPAGIGPDIALELADHELNANLTVLADSHVLQSRAQQLGKEIEFCSPDNNKHCIGKLSVFDIPCAEPVAPGELNAANSKSVIGMIRTATDGCLSDQYDAMVTGPVQKSIINDAGIPFTGHTEYIADRCQTELPVMMLADESLRVCLLTTHLPLKDVSSQITESKLNSVIRIINLDMQRLYGIEKPVIGVCGLNPHAGENGHLGREEIEIIQPALDTLRKSDINLVGPLPADTIFTQNQLETMDVILAMYHDQGLPVIKYRGFGEVVNITLGLPIIRTSVDHGTALDLAGTGKASATSLVSAIKKAVQFAEQKIKSDRS